MALIRYPHKVKHRGELYAPRALIRVDDPEPYIRKGAELVKEESADVDPKPEEKKKRGRRKDKEG